MFLALKEIKHNKLRFGLIVFMIVLISYLIFVLTALAYGLAQSNRSAIDTWQASSIVMNSDADNNLTQSSLTQKQVDEASKVDSPVAVLGQLPVTASRDGGKAKASAQLLGIKPDQFIYKQLKVSEGTKSLGSRDAIVDTGLATSGYKLGDKIRVGSTGPKLKIVGFTKDSKLSVAPVIYTRLATWHTVKFGDTPAAGSTDAASADARSSTQGSAGAGAGSQASGSAQAPSQQTQQVQQRAAQPAANAVVIKDKAAVPTVSGAQNVEINTFIGKLPGYQAQNLTFSFMIVFLFVITLIIIGIFLYILTMQKIPSFAVLKVQGILTRYLVGNTIAQAVVITAAGVLIGGALTVATALAVPPSVPMSFNIPLLSGAAVLLMVMSVAGSLISVRTIAKIDPVSVIGGN